MTKEYIKKLIVLAKELEVFYEGIPHTRWTELDHKIHYLIGFIKALEEKIDDS